MVAGTAAAVGVALANDRRLAPAFVEASSPVSEALITPRVHRGSFPDVRAFIARRISLAVALAAAGIVIAAMVPVVTVMAADRLTPSSAVTAVQFGPPTELRAAAGVAGNWERSYSASVPPADAIGSALLAGAAEQAQRDLESALAALGTAKLAEEEAARQAAAQAAVSAPAQSRAAAYSAGRPSGYAPGTIVRARITVYGCAGPGGGFCNYMASGGAPFEGAAACSYDLPFGTRVRIIGDPTGRIYECLDRGALAATWVDVFFYNTSDGIAWQSTLGGTVADIEIVN